MGASCLEMADRFHGSRPSFIASLLALLAIPSEAAFAADATTRSPGDDLVIELGGGAKFEPSYEGASDYDVSPFPTIKLEYLNVPGLFTIGGGGDDLGFSIGPSFNVTGERDSSDHDELTGLNDVDATYELGLKASYEWEHAEVYGAARYAFGGAEGFVGDVGANAIFRPTSYLEFKIGPVATFAGEDYMDTYFGVTPGESLSTGGRLSAFDAEAGIKSAGVEAKARYEFREDWFLNAEASWTSMVADAKDSPIVEAGDDQQFTVGLGVSKRFSLDLFD
jgi:MipA family protein